VTTTNPDNEKQGVAELLLAALRTAALKAKLDENEITSIGIALRGGLITPAYAVEWLNEIGLTDVVIGDR
jgi:hypothetical protein